MNTPNGKNPLSYLGVTAPQPPNWVTGSTAPTSTLRFPGPTLYIDSSTDSVYATEGDGVFVTLGVGSSGDVVAVNGTANQITASTVAGVVTLSLPAAITAPGSLATTTTLAGGTGVTATTGNITATDGNVVLSGAGRFISMNGGAATDFIGTATLASGTVDVLNTAITAADCVFVTRTALNLSTEVGVFQVVLDPGVKFTINALDPTDGSVATGDLSDVVYFIVRAT